MAYIPSINLVNGKVPVSIGGSSSGNGSQAISEFLTDSPSLKRWRSRLNSFLNNVSGVNLLYILDIGDSLTMGVGASGVTSPSSYLSFAINADTNIYSHSNGIMSAGSPSNRRAGFDTRLTVGSSWTYTTDYTLGGNMFIATTGTNALSFTPTVYCDRFVVWYKITSGNGSFTVDVDGVGLSPQQSTNGANAVGSYTYVGSGSTFNIKWAAGGPVEIIGFVAVDSSQQQIVVINSGWSGGTAADYIDATNPWSPLNMALTLNADLYSISLGTNDWSFGVATSTYGANLQTLVSAIDGISKDCLLVSPIPANPADPFAYNISTSVQRTYCEKMREVALTNDIMFVDIHHSWVDYATSNALGYYFSDFFHGNAVGYRDVGALKAKAIFSQSSGGTVKRIAGSFNATTTTGFQVNGLTVATTRAGNSFIFNGTNGGNSTGPFNACFGSGAGDQVGTGFNNSAFGYNALTGNGFKQQNTAIGATSLTAVTSGNNNTAIGSFSGGIVNTGSNNTILGAFVGSTVLTGGSRNILIGTTNNVTTIASGTNDYFNIGNLITGSLVNAVATTTGINTGQSSHNFVIVASGVNSLQSTNSATTNAPILSAVGSDTDISMAFTPKGAGDIFKTTGTLTQILSGTAFTQTNTVTVGNTTTETSLLGTGVGTKTLPANFLIAGKSVRVKISGIFSTTASPGNLTFTAKLGATTIGTATITNLLANTTDGAFDGTIEFTCRTTGGSGTIMTNGKVSYDIGTFVQGAAALNNTGATTTIDTTTSKAIDITVTWQTANASNTISNTTCFIETLN